MGLTNKKEEQLRQMPIVNTKITKSKDGKYLIHKLEFVTIRPMAYYDAIIQDNQEVQTELDEELQKVAEANKV
ncbi:hypothetical protein K9L67_01120 [Candidatus Woesearchaeota archaeon]|nr:hypothetical protein [Candidatus Woesearchaeota archaeon]MCF7900805.1 hypothetical protein [Candidatus Woesearchaeota archaeon]MCF8013107.1 hypothetical protein [Candidatus Woesearchaeota archaeon]